MNFETEIALLQSSLYCTETDMYNMEEPAEKLQVRGKLLQGISHAVREIINGVEFDRNQTDQCHWNFKLHAILFCKLLENRSKKDGDSSAKTKRSTQDQTKVVNQFGHLKALPDYIDNDIYVHLANEFEWGSKCAKVLRSLEHSISQRLLEDITSQCVTKGFLELAVDLLFNLLIQSNTPGLKSAHSKLFMPEIDFGKTVSSGASPNLSGDCSKLAISSCKEILKIKLCIQDKNQKYKILQSLVACLWYCNSVLSDLLTTDEQGTQCQMDEPKFDILSDCTMGRFEPMLAESCQHRDDHLEDIYRLHLLSLKDSFTTKSYSLSESKSLQLPDKGDISQEKTGLLLKEISELVLTIQSLITGEWEDVFGGVNSNASDTVFEHEEDMDECAALAQSTTSALDTLRETFRKMSDMQHIPDNNLLDMASLQDSCTGLAVYLSEVVGELVEYTASDNVTASPELSETTRRQRGQTSLLEAIDRVDARLERYEADLEWLLSSNDQWENDTLIECLERNTFLLAAPRFGKQLIDMAVKMDQKNDDHIGRILKVFLVSFSAFPLVLQNQLCDYLWSYSSGMSIFTRHCCSDIGQNATSAFNKLVSLADEDQENDESVSALSCMALQSPTQVLQQAVHRAVSNSAVCRTICQMLKAMPSLAMLKLSGAQWPLLCHLIHDAMVAVSESSCEEANLLQLLTTLLQPYKPFWDPQSPFWWPPVLPVTGITQICILPELNSDILRNSGPGHLMLALKFLETAINIHNQAQPECSQCIFGMSLFPIMLCLCKLLDGCRILWDKSSMSSRTVQVKEIVLNLLGIFRRVTAEMFNTDREETQQGIDWLMKSISTSSHWSTALTVTELLPDCLLYKQKIVSSSILDICNVPENLWSAVPHVDYYDTPPLCEQLTDFFLCCRVSDNLASILAENIHMNEETSNCQFLEALTEALVQVLPQCIMMEWQRIMSTLRHILASEILVVPCSACYVVELPIVDISDYSVHLRLSQLLLSVMQVLTSPLCHDWASVPLLNHVTCCCVNTMQQLTLELVNDNTRAPGSSLFVISQFFCHACEVVNCLPTRDLKEQLAVLALEYLSQMEEMRQLTTLSTKPLCFNWTNQARLMEHLANQKLPAEQNSIVMQKIASFR